MGPHLKREQAWQLPLMLAYLPPATAATQGTDPGYYASARMICSESNYGATCTEVYLKQL